MNGKKHFPESYVVSIYGIQLNISGYYYPYESETNTPQEIEIVDVVHESECIKDLLNEGVLKQIECEILVEYY